MNNLSRPDRHRFIKAAEQYLIDRGAIKKETEYLLPTSIGTLRVNIHNEPSSMHSVTTNFFGHEEAAKMKFGHWKNNFRGFDEDVHENVIAFRNHINYLIG